MFSVDPRPGPIRTGTMRRAAIVLLIALLANGCYFGRTPRAKTFNYVANGGLAVIALSVIVAGLVEDDLPCIEMGVEVECNSGHFSATFQPVVVGSILLGAAVLTGLVTYLVPTKRVDGHSSSRRAK